MKKTILATVSALALAFSAPSVSEDHTTRLEMFCEQYQKLGVEVFDLRHLGLTKNETLIFMFEQVPDNAGQHAALLRDISREVTSIIYGLPKSTFSNVSGELVGEVIYEQCLVDKTVF